MLAHLLPFAVIALLAVIAWQLSRRGSTQTQVAGDRVTPEVLRAAIAEADERRSREIAELRDFVAQVNAELAENARTMNVVTRALEVHLTADRQRNEQEWPASVCSTGGHYISRRIHN